MFRKSLSCATFALTLLMLQACGTQNASNGTVAATSTTAPSAPAAATTTATTGGAVANFDATLKSSNTAAYISLADTNDICQDQVQAITTLTNQLQQQLANGGDVQSAITRFNSALQALESCVQSQAASANLPTIPQVDPASSGSNTCSVSSINGQVTQTGDCSNCQVVQSGNSVSTNCSSGSAGSPTVPNTVPNTAPNTNPGITNPSSGSITSNGCSVSVVNGQPTTSGDCTNCQVQNSGNSVSVNCSSN